MTPLFSHLLKSEISERGFVDTLSETPMLAHLGGAACFEYSEVRRLVWDMAEDFVAKADLGATTFLPAPLCWFEYEGEPIRREDWFNTRNWRGLLLRDDGNGRFSGWSVFRLRMTGGVIPDGVKDEISIEPAHFDVSGYLSGLKTFDIDAARNRLAASLVEHGRDVSQADAATAIELYDEYSDSWSGGVNPTPSQLCVLLAFINTPDTIGRVSHPPHKGLIKSAKRVGLTSVFPLHAWTQIKLSVTAASDDEADDATPQSLVGARAFHFCRSHLRVQNGRLVHVRAHMRGDPSKGTKRSRYGVTK